MKLTIRYFAALREALGASSETVEVPDSVRCAGELRAWLRERGGAWAVHLGDARAVRVSVAQAMAEAGTPIADGDEVAFFPPVTGG